MISVLSNVAEQISQFAMKRFSSPYFHKLDSLPWFTFNCIYISIFNERHEQKTLSSDVFYAMYNFLFICSLLRESQDCHTEGLS